MNVWSSHTFRDDQSLKLSLLSRLLHYFSLYGMSADEPENQHGLRLPYSVCPVLGLDVHLRVLSQRISPERNILIQQLRAHPILVVENNRIGSR